MLLFKDRRGEMNPVSSQPVETQRTYAGGMERAQHLATRAEPVALEFVNVLQLDLVIGHAGDFADGRNFARTVAQPGTVRHDVDGARELLPDYLIGNVL